MKQLFYFGCIRECGHYFFPTEHHSGIYYPEDFKKDLGLVDTEKVLDRFDGRYTSETTQDQGAAKEIVGAEFRIIAWHDYSIDGRPGSNSALIGVGHTSAQDMLSDAFMKFPVVMGRQPKPIYLGNP